MTLYFVRLGCPRHLYHGPTGKGRKGSKGKKPQVAFPWGLVPVSTNQISPLLREGDLAGYRYSPHLYFPCSLQALLFGLRLMALPLALYFIPVSANYALFLLMLAVVLVWAAGFALCYGPKAFRAASFPLLLLLLLVPLPFNLMDGIILVLQRGSTELTYALFKLADVPMFREGVTFELPGIGIEVAKECSSIHSGCALFITGLLVGHVFLKTLWTKVPLALLTIPIAMFTNAVRIVTLWFLGTKVDMRFLSGNLHHRGGILFSLISLSVLMSCVALFRKLEPR
jgi:exosortase